MKEQKNTGTPMVEHKRSFKSKHRNILLRSLMVGGAASTVDATIFMVQHGGGHNPPPAYAPVWWLLSVVVSGLSYTALTGGFDKDSAAKERAKARDKRVSRTGAITVFSTGTNPKIETIYESPDNQRVLSRREVYFDDSGQTVKIHKERKRYRPYHTDSH